MSFTEAYLENSEVPRLLVLPAEVLDDEGVLSIRVKGHVNLLGEGVFAATITSRNPGVGTTELSVDGYTPTRLLNTDTSRADVVDVKFRKLGEK